MSSRYLPHTDSDIETMLATIGVPSFEALLGHIPKELRHGKLTMPAALSETELVDRYTALSRQGEVKTSFVGAGLYHHCVPHAVDTLISRGEFFTAYTPYQPEASQGTLQSIFEFQTVAAELLGLDVANASMYDVASAAAEAVLMTLRVLGKRRRVLLSAALHPDAVRVIETYLSHLEVTIETVPLKDGRTDTAALGKLLKDDVACVLVQSPNCLGQVEETAAIAAATHGAGALSVVAVTEPTSLGLLESPGACGADIAVGEGTGIGILPSFGGPGLGLFACKEAYLRQMPGRLAGETKDADGRIGYVLTLATREQHIRREKATSNICTNHGLCALAFTIHAALLGPRGLCAVAEQSAKRARYLVGKLEAVGVKRRFAGPFYNEVVFELGAKVDAVLEKGLSRSLAAGFDLGRWRKEWKGGLMVSVTERHTKARLDELVALVTEVCR
ncbi:MAG: aminomethyl-transferring glycine dehydrogenase subunit GcvPA [Deltaproteobacteria bacterium]|nr:aminomethyl-transferring glycine dehydrogenase subunit GcvPA [Deltaproteobacteria bacterium]